MPGSLLYKLLQAKSTYPLHSAVRLIREDVVFLYLVENNAEVRNIFLFNHFPFVRYKETNRVTI